MTNTRGTTPSFNDKHGEDSSPVVTLVEEHANTGFGIIFASREEAEAFLNDQC